MLNKQVVMKQTSNYASQQQGRESGQVHVVLFEGHFLHWPEQIFVLHLKTDDLPVSEPGSWYQFQHRGEKGKSPFTRHIVITLVGMLISGVQFPAKAALPLSDPNLFKQPVG